MSTPPRPDIERWMRESGVWVGEDFLWMRRFVETARYAVALEERLGGNSAEALIAVAREARNHKCPQMGSLDVSSGATTCCRMCAALAGLEER